MKFTVTIARQLGSGGTEVGHRIADELSIRCIDREIISQTAQQFDLHEHEVAAREEKVLSFWERMLNGFVVGAPEAAYVAPPVQTPSDREIFDAETEVLKSIAAQQDCVIIGRAAVHVLPPTARTLNLLLYAPLDFRVQRVMQLYGAATQEEALARIQRSDSMRGKSIAQMTGKDWMSPENYHLCINTSTFPLDELCPRMADLVRRRMAAC